MFVATSELYSQFHSSQVIGVSVKRHGYNVDILPLDDESGLFSRAMSKTIVTRPAENRNRQD
jgi:hypothetical protein